MYVFFVPPFRLYLFNIYCTTRTRTTQPLFQGTKGPSMREMPLLDILSRSTTVPEQLWPTHGFRSLKVITVSLTFDFLRILLPAHSRTCAFQRFFFYLISPGGVRYP